MDLREAVTILRFNTGTKDDITNKSINNLFDNNSIIAQLQISLNRYANVTKAIEDVYSFTLNTKTPYVPLPTLALRSQTYRAVICNVRNIQYPMDIQGFNQVYSNFAYQGITGIPVWLLPWGNPSEEYFYIFPMKATDSATANLSEDISAIDDTITVDDTTNFIANNGRCAIGAEKFLYGYKDSTHFYNCRRGQEQTIASSHGAADVVSENSVVVFYRRKHRKIVVQNNRIPDTEIDRMLEICDEHIPVILDETTYRLLSKTDTARADRFKVDFEKWLIEAEYDIRKGREAIKQGTNIRDQYRSESAWAGNYAFM